MNPNVTRGEALTDASSKGYGGQLVASTYGEKIVVASEVAAGADC